MRRLEAEQAGGGRGDARSIRRPKRETAAAGAAPARAARNRATRAASEPALGVLRPPVRACSRSDGPVHHGRSQRRDTGARLNAERPFGRARSGAAARRYERREGAPARVMGRSSPAIRRWVRSRDEPRGAASSAPAPVGRSISPHFSRGAGKDAGAARAPRLKRAAERWLTEDRRDDERRRASRGLLAVPLPHSPSRRASTPELG